MATLELEWDSRDLKVWRDRTVDRALFRALKKAGGDALRALRAQSKRKVRSRVAIRAGYLADEALPLSYAKGGTIEGLEWSMRVSGQAVPLGEYPRRQTKQGVSVEVKRGERKLLRSAFLAPRRAGRAGVFLRPTEKRYPMGHRLGLRVSDAMRDGQIPDEVLAFARLRFETAFARLLPLELDK